MGVRAKPGRRDWPSHIHLRKGLWYWRHPKTGHEFPLGRDKGAAFREAIAANAHIARATGHRSLVDRIEGRSDTSVVNWIAVYEGIQEAKQEAGTIKADTLSGVKQRLRYVKEAWGTKDIRAVTTMDVADFLGAYQSAGKARMAQAYRSLLFDLFREAQAKGWTKENPVQPTKGVSVTVRRQRLTLEVFKAIHAYAVEHMPPRVARSMELALLTGQRREDIREMRFKPDGCEEGAWIDGGTLYVIQSKGKGKNKVAIPLPLSLGSVGWTLAAVVASCRDKALSRYLVHHDRHAGRAKPGDQVRNRTITAEFAECRDACIKAGTIKPYKGTPPSFHEIRSLAARLYEKERGKDFAQALLGHKSAEMTALYRDERGAEWVKVPL